MINKPIAAHKALGLGDDSDAEESAVTGDEVHDDFKREMKLWVHINMIDRSKKYMFLKNGQACHLEACLGKEIKVLYMEVKIALQCISTATDTNRLFVNEVN